MFVIFWAAPGTIRLWLFLLSRTSLFVIEITWSKAANYENAYSLYQRKKKDIWLQTWQFVIGTLCNAFEFYCPLDHFQFPHFCSFCLKVMDYIFFITAHMFFVYIVMCFYEENYTFFPSNHYFLQPIIFMKLPAFLQTPYLTCSFGFRPSHCSAHPVQSLFLLVWQLVSLNV